MARVRTAHRGQVTVRIELTCLYCGHACGDVFVRTAGTPTYLELRAAFTETTTTVTPLWDAHGAPRCPRCRAKLFIAKSERRIRDFAR
jgi:anaerobic selenocysteine-containing dehydrogenase